MTDQLSEKTSLGVKYGCGSSDDKHEFYHSDITKQAKIEELVADTEIRKNVKFRGSINKNFEEIECCRTCKNNRKCTYKKQFTSKGYASVGSEFKEFVCKNYKPRNPTNSTNSNIKSLVKSFKRQFNQIKIPKE